MIRRFMAKRKPWRAAGPLGVVAVGLVIAQVVLAAPPSVSFTASDDVPEVGQNVSFTSSVSDDDPGDTHLYAWDFGDGATSTSESPSHAYDVRGVMSVTLTVTDAAGESDAFTRQVRVNAPPTAAFTVDFPNPRPNQFVTFTSTSNDPEGAVIHAWDLDDDGAFDDGSDASEIRAFPTGGDYTVRLRVTDSDGVQRTTSQTVSVLDNILPVASFTVSGTNPVTPAVPDVGETINLTSTSSDPDGTISRVDWDLDNDGSFDDGSRSPMPLQFQTAGQKTVGLRATDSSGGTHSTTQTFRVNALPTAAINISNAEREAGQKRTVPLEGQDFIFTSAGVQAIPGASPAPGCPVLTGSPAGPASSDPEGALSTFEWDLDGDGLYGTEDAEPVGATAASPATGYPAGPRTVGLRVTDSDGARDTETLSFNVNAPPTPSFLIEPITPVINETTMFFATASDPNDPPTSLTYSWDVDNDGIFCEPGESGPSANRTFPTASMNPGHPVTLRVTDTGGITRALTRSVVVQNTIPNGAISFSPTAPLPGQAITFTGSATSPTGKAIASLEWDFDFDRSGQFSTDAVGTSVSHAFGGAGAKSIALRVTEVGGGFAIVTGTVVVNAPPSAALQVSPADPFVRDSITLSSTAVDPDGPIASHNWDLDGDGQFDDAAGPVVSTSYPTAGRRTVRLRVTDSKGAVATASGVIDVRTRPAVAFSVFKVQLGVAFSEGFTEVIRLRVRAPGGTLLTVRCKGKGCPKRAVKSRSKGRLIRFKALERRLRPGAKLIVTGTKAGFIGEQTTFTIRPGREPKRVDRCLMPGAKKATRCPA
jgi:large repetitive protein